MAVLFTAVLKFYGADIPTGRWPLWVVAALLLSVD
nr:MAG TPA: Photosystem II protein D1, Photosystem protein [Caudoviricetes sp.]